MSDAFSEVIGDRRGRGTAEAGRRSRNSLALDELGAARSAMRIWTAAEAAAWSAEQHDGLHCTVCDRERYDRAKPGAMVPDGIGPRGGQVFAHPECIHAQRPGT